LKHYPVGKVEKRIASVEASVNQLTEKVRLLKTVAGKDGGGAAGTRQDREKNGTASITVDREGNITGWSEGFKQLLGIEKEPDGQNIREFVPLHMQELYRDCIVQLGDNLKFYINLLHSSGLEIPVRLQASPAANLGSGCIRMLVEDRSYRRKLEEELEASRESYQTLAETASDAIIQLRMDFTIQFANSAVKRIFGYESRDLKDKYISVLFPESRYKRYEGLFNKYFIIDDTHRQETGLQNTIEVLGRRPDGELIPLEISFGNSKGIGSNRILTCIIRDIALRKKAERRLKFLAYHDKLTSLGNRDRLSEYLDQLLAEIGRDPERKAALMFLDLDGFKKVNDSLGHEMGDMILKECARRLSNCLRQEDNVYRIEMEDIFRLGGDEFTILLPRINKPEDAAVVARRIIQRILEPFNLEGYGQISDISMGVSVGIAMIPDDGMDKTTLLRNADAAMYNAKEIGNTYVFFTKEMNNKAVERLFLEEGLRKSIGDKDFELFYQPIVDRNGALKGLEALVRWNHPVQGIILPEKFIPVAEDTRLILPIGRWVLETACRHVKYWADLGMDDFYVSLNISPVQLDKEDLPAMVSKTVQKVGIRSSFIMLELTETSLMVDPKGAMRKMSDLVHNNEGLKIAVDDFGTGYSSLGYLSRFPFHTLKIDRSFVRNLDSNINNVKIINSILSLGKSLDLHIIAEGVETRKQLEFLADKGCMGFQGHLFAEALSFSKVTEYIQQDKSLL